MLMHLIKSEMLATIGYISLPFRIVIIDLFYFNIYFEKIQKTLRNTNLLSIFLSHPAISIGCSPFLSIHEIPRDLVLT